MKSRPIPPILINIIYTALQVCDGVRFHSGRVCQNCGGTLSGYDARKKRFAVLFKDGEQVPVYVIVQRSYCHTCGEMFNPPVPYYPGTRVGMPVVDLCRTFSTVMPYNRVSTYLARMGVIVDRWSVRHYATASLPDVPSLDVFGMKMPVSLIALSTLAGSLSGNAQLEMDDVLMACNYALFAPSLLMQSDETDLGENS